MKDSMIYWNFVQFSLPFRIYWTRFLRLHGQSSLVRQMWQTEEDSRKAEQLARAIVRGRDHSMQSRLFSNCTWTRITRGPTLTIGFARYAWTGPRLLVVHVAARAATASARPTAEWSTPSTGGLPRRAWPKEALEMLCKPDDGVHERNTASSSPLQLTRVRTSCPQWRLAGAVTGFVHQQHRFSWALPVQQGLGETFVSGGQHQGVTLNRAQPHNHVATTHSRDLILVQTQWAGPETCPIARDCTVATTTQNPGKSSAHHMKIKTHFKKIRNGQHTGL